MEIANNRKLIALISLFLVVGFVVTSFASYFVSRQSLRSEIKLKALPLTSDNIYSEIQRDLLRPVFISSLMASNTFLRDWVVNGEKDQTKLIKYLKEIKIRYNTFTSFFVSDQTKNYYHVDGILKRVSPTEERDSWYFRVRQMKDDYEINVDPDMANKDTMTIFINYRVYDYDQKYIGATGVGLTVTSVKSLIEKYQKKYNRNIYFIDKTGNIKLASEKIFKSNQVFFKDKNPLAYLDKADKKAESSFKYKRGKELVHANIRYISEFGWYLIVEQGEDETIRHIFTTLIMNLVITLVITMIITALVHFAVTTYQQRLETLRGIVPICSFCKQVRDDKGYWNQVEAYVSKHTDAQFSHGVCPTCRDKHYSKYLSPARDKSKDKG